MVAGRNRPGTGVRSPHRFGTGSRCARRRDLSVVAGPGIVRCALSLVPRRGRAQARSTGMCVVLTRPCSMVDATRSPWRTFDARPSGPADATMSASYTWPYAPTEVGPPHGRPTRHPPSPNPSPSGRDRPAVKAGDLVWLLQYPLYCRIPCRLGRRWSRANDRDSLIREPRDRGRLQRRTIQARTASVSTGRLAACTSKARDPPRRRHAGGFARFAGQPAGSVEGRERRPDEHPNQPAVPSLLPVGRRQRRRGGDHGLPLTGDGLTRSRPAVIRNRHEE